MDKLISRVVRKKFVICPVNKFKTLKRAIFTLCRFFSHLFFLRKFFKFIIITNAKKIIIIISSSSKYLFLALCVVKNFLN